MNGIETTKRARMPRAERNAAKQTNQVSRTLRRMQALRGLQIAGWLLIAFALLWTVTEKEQYGGDAYTGIQNALVEVGALLMALFGGMLLALRNLALWLIARLEQIEKRMSR